MLLAACGSSHKLAHELVAGSEPVAVRQGDAAVMNGLLGLEYTAIAAYEAGIPLLTGHAREAAARFLSQELAHAAKLEATVRGAGARPSSPPASYSLGSPSSEADVLDVLRGVESAAVNGYLVAIPRLAPGWLRSVAAGILANEAQHISMLRMLQGQPSVPSAFVTASE